jgi:hypothetical protein
MNIIVNLTIPEANLRLKIRITTTTITTTIADDIPAAIPTTALLGSVIVLSAEKMIYVWYPYNYNYPFGNCNDHFVHFVFHLINLLNTPGI